MSCVAQVHICKSADGHLSRIVLHVRLVRWKLGNCIDAMMTLRQFAAEPATLPTRTTWYLTEFAEARWVIV
jgi:hypothetical protein